jgi:2-aminoadipate transaminase
VFLTTGAQQALALLARVLLEPGGPIVCERLVYMGFQAAVEPFSPRVLTVGTDLQTGIDVDAVEAHLARGERPAFLYVITDGHNPLGVSVSLEKRVRLAELARQYRVPLIEDDAYGMLHLEEPVLPIRSLEDRWVLYVGSFSKVLSPAFRVGWCVVPEELVPLLGAVKDGLDVDTASFTQRLVSEYLSAGGFPAHLARARAAYRERRDRMLAALRDEFPAGTRWSVPRNGALVWAELPGGIDAGALLRASLEREMVAFVPGRAFAFAGSDAGGSSLRLNFSFPTPGQIDEGMRRLGRLAGAALA